MSAECTLPYSQQSVTGPYSEPEEYDLYSQKLFIYGKDLHYVSRQVSRQGWSPITEVRGFDNVFPQGMISTEEW
jgi:hypothetical protein